MTNLLYWTDKAINTCVGEQMPLSYFNVLKTNKI